MAKRINNIDELALLKGVPIAVGNNTPIIVNNPTLDEISMVGEEQYMSAINAITATPSSMKVFLNDNFGLDWTKVDDFQLFIMMFEGFKSLNLSYLIGGFRFSDMIVTENDKGKPVLRHKRDGWDLTAGVYDKMMDYLRQIHHLEKLVEIPGNEHTRRYLLEKDRRKARRNKVHPEEYKPYVAFLVKQLVNCQHFKYNFEDVWKLNIYTFLESVHSIEKLYNYTFTMTGAYGGMAEYKTSTITKAHWLNRD